MIHLIIIVIQDSVNINHIDQILYSKNIKSKFKMCQVT